MNKKNIFLHIISFSIALFSTTAIANDVEEKSFDNDVYHFFDAYNSVHENFHILHPIKKNDLKKAELLLSISKKMDYLSNKSNDFLLVSWDFPEHKIAQCNLIKIGVESGVASRSSYQLAQCSKDSLCEKDEIYEVKMNRSMSRLYELMKTCSSIMGDKSNGPHERKDQGVRVIDPEK